MKTSRLLIGPLFLLAACSGGQSAPQTGVATGGLPEIVLAPYLLDELDLVSCRNTDAVRCTFRNKTSVELDMLALEAFSFNKAGTKVSSDSMVGKIDPSGSTEAILMFPANVPDQVARIEVRLKHPEDVRH